MSGIGAKPSRAVGGHMLFMHLFLKGLNEAFWAVFYCTFKHAPEHATNLWKWNCWMVEEGGGLKVVRLEILGERGRVGEARRGGIHPLSWQ